MTEVLETTCANCDGDVNHDSLACSDCGQKLCEACVEHFRESDSYSDEDGDLVCDECLDGYDEDLDEDVEDDDLDDDQDPDDDEDDDE